MRTQNYFRALNKISDRLAEGKDLKTTLYDVLGFISKQAGMDVITSYSIHYTKLYDNSFTSLRPNTSFSFSAITANEYESLHCPASSTLGMPLISPKSSLL